MTRLSVVEDLDKRSTESAKEQPYPIQGSHTPIASRLHLEPLGKAWQEKTADSMS